MTPVYPFTADSQPDPPHRPASTSRDEKSEVVTLAKAYWTPKEMQALGACGRDSVDTGKYTPYRPPTIPHALCPSAPARNDSKKIKVANKSLVVAITRTIILLVL